MLPAPPFQLLERYDVVEEIGRGGHAVVFRAHDRQLARDVAIKVLREDVVGSADVVKRFVQEIQLLATLEHPHILHVHDSGTVDGQPFVVMELAPQATLAHRLERESQVPIADAVQIAREIGSALAHAHARSILHRDVKPENILLGAGGAVLADFGIARVTGEHDISRITSTGEAVGTLQYMSPEQLCAEPIDARSDQYALGLVLYEMLSGVRPHAAPTIDALRALRVTGQHVPLSVYRSAVSPAFESIIARMMAVAPADRFRSMDEFLMALSVLGTAESPSGSGGYEVLRTPTRSQPGVSVIPGTASGALTDARAENDARRRRWMVASAAVVTLVAAISIAEWAGAGSDDGAFVVRLVSSDDTLSAGVREAVRDELMAWTGVDVRDGGRSGLRVTTSVTRLGDSAQLRLHVEARDSVPARDVRRVVSLRGVDSMSGVVASMARELLAGRSLDSLRGLDGMPARSLPALRAYVRGWDLLYGGQLDSASVAFRAARDAAPGFAAAHLWAAQSAAWARPKEVSTWQSDVDAALRIGVADPTSLLLLRGLDHFAHARYPESCDAFASAAGAAPDNFIVWVDRAYCLQFDPVVVGSGNARHFRGGGWTALAMYRRAIPIAPTADLLKAVSPRIFSATFARRGQYRTGITEAGQRVYALPTAVADSVAFFPVDSAQFVRGVEGSVPASLALATRRNIAAWVQLTDAWTRRFPTSADGWLSRAEALEMAGMLHVTDIPSAERALDSARLLGGDAIANAVSVGRLRLALRRGAIDSAVSLARALLATQPGGHAGTTRINRATLAALTLDSRFLAQAVADAYSDVPSSARDALRGLYVATLVGDCSRFPSVRDQAVAALTHAFARNEYEAARRRLLAPLIRMSAPCSGPSVIRDAEGTETPLDPTLHALLRGDRPAALVELRRLEAKRAGATIAEVSWDAHLLEAWATASAGDTVAGIARIVGALDDLASMSASTLEEPESAGGLSRSLLLLTDLTKAFGEARARTALPAARRHSFTNWLLMCARMFETRPGAHR